MTFSVLRAKRLLVAMGPTLANRLTYEPPLPPTRQQLMRRSFMGSIIKTHAYYRVEAGGKSPWDAAAFSGQLVSDVGPVSATYAEPIKAGSNVFGIMVRLARDAFLMHLYLFHCFLLCFGGRRVSFWPSTRTSGAARRPTSASWPCANSCAFRRVLSSSVCSHPDGADTRDCCRMMQC